MHMEATPGREETPPALRRVETPSQGILEMPTVEMSSTQGARSSILPSPVSIFKASQAIL